VVLSPAAMSIAFARPPIPVIVQQHAEESAALRHVRSVLVRAPHVRLHQLRRLDDRIAAHLDGLVVAGDYGASLCMAALERPGAGEVFAAGALALERRDPATLDRLIALAATLPEAKRGLLSAFGWVSADSLKGVVAPLLASADPLRRELGLGACRMHAADPGPALHAALGDADTGVRIAALRTAGALGRRDLLDAARDASRDVDPQVQRHAATAATLLGDRGPMLGVVAESAQRDASDSGAELALALQASEFDAARQLVRSLARTAASGPSRRLVRACGLLGDTHFVPWLIGLMDDDRFARLAGESFSMITGADLAALDLERKPPQDFAAGPSDDPEDADVALDEDESLPWPEQGLVQRWWHSRAETMPAGRRLFLGRAPSLDGAVHALSEGFQRQRLLAAQWCCLLAPGTKLFATAAPAWRQQRRLAKAT
jgi:uncharacterized protein (TIGR02270 family)